MVNHIRQLFSEARTPIQTVSGVFQQGGEIFWFHEGRFYMKGPGIPKREISQDAYEFAKGELDNASDNAVTAKPVVSKAKPEKTFDEADEDAASKEMAELTKPSESCQGAIDSLNSRADAIDETQFGTGKPEPEPTPKPMSPPAPVPPPLKPAPKQNPKPETAPVPAPKSEPESVPAPKPEPKQKPKPQPVTAPELEPENEPIAQQKPQPETAPQPQIAPEPELESLAQPESNPLKQIFPGVKSMTIEFHEDSKPA
jgi:hypothetical protein